MPYPTYDVEIVAGDPTYCPYCNMTHALDRMSDEHVIPDCIGGQIVIRACRKCNSSLGQKVDPLLTRQINVRMMATEAGSGLSWRDRVIATVILKDGRLIEAFVAINFVDRNHFKFECVPVAVQPDGSRWVPFEAANPKLPPNINVFHQDDVDRIGFKVADPPAAAAPAIVKIVLGALYQALGRAVVQRSDFDALRKCLSGTLHPELKITALPLGQSPVSAPVQTTYGIHLIWAECDGGQTLRGGVSLFGRINYEIEMPAFGDPFPGRCLESRGFLRQLA